MQYEQYLTEEQDPKVVEKTLTKIKDLLTQGEVIHYIAVQKKPAVNLLPDCIAISNKRIFLCEATKLGLTTNFEIFSWKEIKSVTFKEEFFGAKFTVIPRMGENLTVEYIPRVQARKLYQLSVEAMEQLENKQKLEEERAQKPREEQERVLLPEEEPVLKKETPEDELTAKLTRLKTLFDRQLISQAEYESKKNELLSQL